MDKLKLTGLNLGRVFHSRLGHACIGHAIVYITKQPNLNSKIRPKQLLGSLLLDIALPDSAHFDASTKKTKFYNIGTRYTCTGTTSPTTSSRPTWPSWLSSTSGGRPSTCRGKTTSSRGETPRRLRYECRNPLRYIIGLGQGILKGEVSLYHWPPVWLVWNQLYDNWQFLCLFAKQTNPNQSNRRSTVQ